MLDIQTPIVMQRTKGRAEVSFGVNGLQRLHQSGSAKAMLPKVHSDVPEVVFLNTAGGLTGGDRLDYRVEVPEGREVVATTQTAERAYAASDGVAEVGVSLHVGAGGALDWLPQETILFDQSGLARRTEVDLAGDARFLFVETVVLGRAAMGETVQGCEFKDTRRIRRDGRLEYFEPLGIDDLALGRRSGAATLQDNRAIATVGLFCRNATDALEAVRDVLTGEDVEAAASAWDGKLIVRAMAADGFPLRRQVARVLNVLRQKPLPRVWQE